MEVEVVSQMIVSGTCRVRKETLGVDLEMDQGRGRERDNVRKE